MSWFFQPLPAAAGSPLVYDFDAQPGTYSFTGAAAGLGRELSLNCAPGSFSVTGVAATFAVTVEFNAQPGTYSFTGAATGLVRELFINAAPGSVAITGVAATFSKERNLVAEPGSFTVNGVSAALVRELSLNAQPGALAITGVAASLVREFNLNAQPGTVVITGFAATLETTAPAVYDLVAEPGAFVVNGVDAALETPSGAPPSQGIGLGGSGGWPRGSARVDISGLRYFHAVEQRVKKGEALSDILRERDPEEVAREVAEAQAAVVVQKAADRPVSRTMQHLITAAERYLVAKAAEEADEDDTDALLLLSLAESL